MPSGVVGIKTGVVGIKTGVVGIKTGAVGIKTGRRLSEDCRIVSFRERADLWICSHGTLKTPARLWISREALWRGYVRLPACAGNGCLANEVASLSSSSPWLLSLLLEQWGRSYPVVISPPPPSRSTGNKQRWPSGSAVGRLGLA